MAIEIETSGFLKFKNVILWTETVFVFSKFFFKILVWIRLGTTVRWLTGVLKFYIG